MPSPVTPISRGTPRGWRGSAPSGPASSPATSSALAAGWTACAVFAHLAFWDRLVIARWDRYDREGVIGDLPDAHTDLVNAAGLPLWRALTAGEAVVEALDAAGHVCERIASLSPAAVAVALDTGRLAMLDRTLHWSPHLDALAGAPDPCR